MSSDARDALSLDELEAAVLSELDRRGLDVQAAAEQLRQARASDAPQVYRTALQYRLDSLLLSWQECRVAARLLGPVEVPVPA